MAEQTIILDDNDLKFDYTDVEIAKFRTYWQAYRNYSDNTIEIINQLAKDLGMSADNVMLLALDQVRKGAIE